VGSASIILLETSGALGIYSLRTHQFLFQTPPSHTEAIYTVRIDPGDHDVLCSAGFDGIIRQWAVDPALNWGQGGQPFLHSTPWGRALHARSFAPVDLGSPVFKWGRSDLGKNALLRYPSVFDVQYCPDPGVPLLLACYSNGYVRLYDKSTGRHLANPLNTSLHYNTVLMTPKLDYFFPDYGNSTLVNLFADQLVFPRPHCCAWAQIARGYRPVYNAIVDGSYMFATGWSDGCVRVCVCFPPRGKEGSRGARTSEAQDSPDASKTPGPQAPPGSPGSPDSADLSAAGIFQTHGPVGPDISLFAQRFRLVCTISLAELMHDSSANDEVSAISFVPGTCVCLCGTRGGIVLFIDLSFLLTERVREAYEAVYFGVPSGTANGGGDKESAEVRQFIQNSVLPNVSAAQRTATGTLASKSDRVADKDGLKRKHLEPLFSLTQEELKCDKYYNYMDLAEIADVYHKGGEKVLSIGPPQEELPSGRKWDDWEFSSGGKRSIEADRSPDLQELYKACSVSDGTKSRRKIPPSGYKNAAAVYSISVSPGGWDDSDGLEVAVADTNRVVTVLSLGAAVRYGAVRHTSLYIYKVFRMLEPPGDASRQAKESGSVHAPSLRVGESETISHDQLLTMNNMAKVVRPSVALLPGRLPLLAILGPDLGFQVINYITGQLIEKLRGASTPVTALAFHPTSASACVLGGRDGVVRVCRLQSFPWERFSVVNGLWDGMRPALGLGGHARAGDTGVGVATEGEMENRTENLTTCGSLSRNSAAFPGKLFTISCPAAHLADRRVIADSWLHGAATARLDDFLAIVRNQPNVSAASCAYRPDYLSIRADLVATCICLEVLLMGNADVPADLEKHAKELLVDLRVEAGLSGLLRDRDGNDDEDKAAQDVVSAMANSEILSRLLVAAGHSYDVCGLGQGLAPNTGGSFVPNISLITAAKLKHCIRLLLLLGELGLVESLLWALGLLDESIIVSKARIQSGNATDSYRSRLLRVATLAAGRGGLEVHPRIMATCDSPPLGGSSMLGRLEVWRGLPADFAFLLGQASLLQRALSGPEESGGSENGWSASVIEAAERFSALLLVRHQAIEAKIVISSLRGKDVHNEESVRRLNVLATRASVASAQSLCASRRHVEAACELLLAKRYWHAFKILLLSGNAQLVLFSILRIVFCCRDERDQDAGGASGEGRGKAAGSVTSGAGSPQSFTCSGDHYLFSPAILRYLGLAVVIIEELRLSTPPELIPGGSFRDFSDSVEGISNVLKGEVRCPGRGQDGGDIVVSPYDLPVDPYGFVLPPEVTARRFLDHLMCTAPEASSPSRSAGDLDELAFFGLVRKDSGQIYFSGPQKNVDFTSLVEFIRLKLRRELAASLGPVLAVELSDLVAAVPPHGEPGGPSGPTTSPADRPEGLQGPEGTEGTSITAAGENQSRESPGNSNDERIALAGGFTDELSDSQYAAVVSQSIGEKYASLALPLPEGRSPSAGKASARLTGSLIGSTLSHIHIDSTDWLEVSSRICFLGKHMIHTMWHTFSGVSNWQGLLTVLLGAAGCSFRVGQLQVCTSLLQTGIRAITRLKLEPCPLINELVKLVSDPRWVLQNASLVPAEGWNAGLKEEEENSSEARVDSCVFAGTSMFDNGDEFLFPLASPLDRFLRFSMMGLV